MRALINCLFGLLCLTLLSACGEMTPAGPLGTIDLRPKLPEAIRGAAPKDEQAKGTERSVKLGEPQVEVLVRSRSFEHQGGKYLVSIELEVVEPARGTVLAYQVGNAVNMGSLEAVEMRLPLMLTATHKGWSGTNTRSVAGQVSAKDGWTQP